MNRETLISLISVVFLLIGACSSQESSSSSTSETPSTPAPAEAPAKQAEAPAEPAAPAVPAGQKRVALGPLTAFTVDVPEAAAVSDDGGDAMVQIEATGLMFHVGRSEGDDTRAHHEQRYTEAAPTLTVERTEDLDNGWVLVARRSPSGFDFKRYRSDLDLMCYQRVLPNQEILNQAIAACDSIQQGN